MYKIQEPPMFRIGFGPMKPPIQEQLASQGARLTKSDAILQQRLIDAMVLLHVHGVITDGEFKRAGRRLFVRVMDRARAIVGWRDPKTGCEPNCKCAEG